MWPVIRENQAQHLLLHHTLPRLALDWYPYLALCDSPVAAEVRAAVGPVAPRDAAEISAYGIQSTAPARAATARASPGEWLQWEQSIVPYEQRMLCGVEKARPPLAVTAHLFAMASLAHLVGTLPTGTAAETGLRCWRVTRRAREALQPLSQWCAHVGVANASWAPLRLGAWRFAGMMKAHLDAPHSVRARINAAVLNLAVEDIPALRAAIA